MKFYTKNIISLISFLWVNIIFISPQAEEISSNRLGPIIASTYFINNYKIIVRKIEEKDHFGNWIPNGQILLKQSNVKSEFFPIITVTGHSPELKTLDLNKDGVKELIFLYHSGGNQTIAQIFKINSETLSLIKGPDISSNLSQIEFIEEEEKFKIITKNQNITFQGRHLISKVFEFDGNLLKEINTKN